MADLFDINYAQLANPFAGLLAQKQRQVDLAAQNAAQIQQQVFAQQQLQAQNAAYMERARQREQFDFALEQIREIHADARSDKDRINRLKELTQSLDAHTKQAVLLKYGVEQKTGESLEQAISRGVGLEAKKNTDVLKGFQNQIKGAQNRFDDARQAAEQNAVNKIKLQALTDAKIQADLTGPEAALGDFNTIYKNLAGNRATQKKAEAFRVAHEAALSQYQSEEAKQRFIDPLDNVAIKAAAQQANSLLMHYDGLLRSFGGNVNPEAFQDELPSFPPPQNPDAKKELPPPGWVAPGAKTAPVGGIAPIPRNEIIAQIAEKLGVPNARPVDVLPGLGRNMLRKRPLTDQEAQALGASMLPELDRRMRTSRGSGAKEYFDAINLIRGVPAVPIAPQSQIFSGAVPPEYAPYSAPSFTPVSGAEDLPQF